MCDLCSRRSFMRGAIDAHKVVAEARVAFAGARERAKWR